jgi:type IV secretion system protein VirD4
LGEQTVLTGSVSHGRDKSQSLQMIGRPLMTVDELKSMPKGQFIVMKTGTSPMISKLKLFFKWGISFDEPYILSDKGAREVSYISKEKLMKAVELKYLQKEKELIYYDDEDDEFDSKIRLKTGG